MFVVVVRVISQLSDKDGKMVGFISRDITFIVFAFHIRFYKMGKD